MKHMNHDIFLTLNEGRGEGRHGVFRSIQIKHFLWDQYGIFIKKNTEWKALPAFNFLLKFSERYYFGV